MNLQFKQIKASFTAGQLCLRKRPMMNLWNAWPEVSHKLFEAYLTGTLPAFLVIAAASWLISHEVKIWRR